MRIGIDASGINSYRTGTATYLVEILTQWNIDRSLEHVFVIFCSPNTRHHFDALKLDHRFELVMVSRIKLIQMFWQQTGLPLALWRGQFNVLWGPGFVLPFLPVCPMVVTIHDLTFELFPGVHQLLKRIYFPRMIRFAVKNARQVLAISQSTAQDLAKAIPASRHKTTVTLLAARSALSEQSVAAKPLLPKPAPYALFVGTLEPRKNLVRLIQAWTRLTPGDRQECRLIVIGMQGWMVGELEQIAANIDSVDFMGHVSDRELHDYLEQALFFVYPSLYEGFGLPVIEAMAYGIPVLTSALGATEEIAHGAAVLVDPLNVDAIADGIRALLTNEPLRQRLSRAGRERAQQFSWERTAKLTLKALQTAAKPKST
ncbi:MAG: glycosyltransferase family 4 protein [Burkholderiales bacterium]|nr:glycosyltransferase family 4 protein [Burkholderiales bacterium]